MIKGPGRPKGGYYTESGKRVPSVTTILGKFKDPGGLIQWGYKTGLRQGFAHGRNGVSPPGLYADKAAEIGTVVHDAVEAFVHGTIADLCLAETEGYAELSDSQADKAEVSFGAFLRWWEIVQPEITHTEIPLVSEELHVGGTMDAVATLGGRRVVLDWKTSRRIYDDYKIQLAAYAHLWGEVQGETLSEAHVLRFDKITGAFAHESIPNLDPYLRVWLNLVESYQILKGAA